MRSTHKKLVKVERSEQPAMDRKALRLESLVELRWKQVTSRCPLFVEKTDGQRSKSGAILLLLLRALQLQKKRVRKLLAWRHARSTHKKLVKVERSEQPARAMDQKALSLESLVELHWKQVASRCPLFVEKTNRQRSTFAMDATQCDTTRETLASSVGPKGKGKGDDDKRVICSFLRSICRHVFSVHSSFYCSVGIANTSWPRRTR